MVLLSDGTQAHQMSSLAVNVDIGACWPVIVQDAAPDADGQVVMYCPALAQQGARPWRAHESRVYSDDAHEADVDAAAVGVQHHMAWVLRGGAAPPPPPPPSSVPPPACGACVAPPPPPPPACGACALIALEDGPLVSTAPIVFEDDTRVLTATSSLPPSESSDDSWNVLPRPRWCRAARARARAAAVTGGLGE